AACRLFRSPTPPPGAPTFFHNGPAWGSATTKARYPGASMCGPPAASLSDQGPSPPPAPSTHRGEGPPCWPETLAPGTFLCCRQDSSASSPPTTTASPTTRSPNRRQNASTSTSNSHRCNLERSTAPIAASSGHC